MNFQLPRLMAEGIYHKIPLNFKPSFSYGFPQVSYGFPNGSPTLRTTPLGKNPATWKLLRQLHPAGESSKIWMEREDSKIYLYNGIQSISLSWGYIHIQCLSWIDIEIDIPFLIGGWATHLKNMSSSVGMMTFRTEWKNKKCPNHQSELNFMGFSWMLVLWVFMGIW